MQVCHTYIRSRASTERVYEMVHYHTFYQRVFICFWVVPHKKIFGLIIIITYIKSSFFLLVSTGATLSTHNFPLLFVFGGYEGRVIKLYITVFHGGVVGLLYHLFRTFLMLLIWRLGYPLFTKFCENLTSSQ